MSDYRTASTIATDRLVLTPLRVDDAEEMVRVLDDERLHEFIGGRPAALDELRDRYRRLAAGPENSSEVWLNWIVRHRQQGTAIGTVQATVTDPAHPAASVAWVIGAPWQGHGFASEAAAALIAWLGSQGVDRISASIHPEHRASAGVAARIGLEPTDEHHDGETVWQLPAKELS